MIKQIDTPVAKLSLQEDVLTVVLKENAELSNNEFESLLNQAMEFVEYKKHYVIIDTRFIYTANSETRKIYAESPHKEYRHADAFIVNSLAMRLLVNFYIKFQRPEIPARMFNNEKAALVWINELKKINHQSF